MNTNIYAVKREKGSNEPIAAFFYEGDYNTREPYDLINNRDWNVRTKYDGWKILTLDGIGPTENEIFSEKKGHGDGVIITGKRMQERHIDMEIRQGAGVNVQQRHNAIDFHDPNYVYDLCFTWMGQTRWLCDCEIEAFKIETGKVNKKQVLTVSYLCAESYYSINNKFELPAWEGVASISKSIAVGLDPNDFYEEDFFVYPIFEATINAAGSARLDFVFMGEPCDESISVQVQTGDKFRIEHNEGWEYTDAYNLYQIRNGSVINTWPNYFSFSFEGGRGKLQKGHTALFSVSALTGAITAEDINVDVTADASEAGAVMGFEMITGCDRTVEFTNEQNDEFRGPYILEATDDIELIECGDAWSEFYMLPFCVRFGLDDTEIYEYFCESDIGIRAGDQIQIYNYFHGNVGGYIVGKVGEPRPFYAYGSSGGARHGDPFREAVKESIRTEPAEKNVVYIMGDESIINNFDMTIITGPDNIRGI